MVSALTGMGFGLVLGPVAFALLEPEAAVLALIVLSIVVNLLVLLGERRRPRVAWGETAPIVVASVPGAACGVLILRALPKSVLQIVVGVGVIAAGLVRVRARRNDIAAATGPGRGGARLALGFALGALTTSTSITGPPLALWLSRRGYEPSVVRD